MPQTIEVNGEPVEFPDDMSDDEIVAAIERNAAQQDASPEQDPAVPQAEPSSDRQSVLNRAKALGLSLGDAAGGLAETALVGAQGMLSEPIAGYAGMITGALPGGKSAAEGVESVRNLPIFNYSPRTETGRGILGAAGGAMQRVERAADTIGEVTGDPEDTLGATAVKTGLLAVPMALGGRGMMRSARQAAQNVPPTVPELLSQSNAAYSRARSSGATIRPESIGSLEQRLAAAADRINPELHPDSTAALRAIRNDLESGDLTLDQLDVMRQIASDAKGAQRPADQRIASRIVNAIDEYADDLSPNDVIGDVAAVEAFKEGRSLYSRGKKAEQIEEMIDTAQVRAAKNFSQSGMENALRTEFMKLFANKKKLRLFNEKERAAIRRVAEGGPLGNAMRELGKYAPTSAFAALQSAGLGAGAAAVTGGSMLLGSIGLPMAGAVGRTLATRMTIANARRAAELARRGPDNQR